MGRGREIIAELLLPDHRGRIEVVDDRDPRLRIVSSGVLYVTAAQFEVMQATFGDKLRIDR